MDQIKKRKKKKIEYFDPIEHQDIQDQEDSDLEVLRHVQTKHLRYGMHKLRPEERTILLMFYQDDYSVEAISATLSIGKSAVKMRLKRARDKLTSLVKPLVNHELER
jgi:RNA polymerase sigma-70 factor (ECF subfamily)